MTELRMTTVAEGISFARIERIHPEAVLGKWGD